MKICIIGNSHVGALKRAWNSLGAKHPRIHITFFGHRGNGMSGLKAEGARLVPDNESLLAAMKFTSGGHSHIDPNEYDIILLYGLKAKPYLGAGEPGVSLQARNQAIEDVTGKTLAFGILKKLRGITDKRIHLAQDPLRAAKVVKSRRKPADYLAGVGMLNESVYHPLNAELVAQPASTIVNRKFTDPEFAKGSKRLEIGNKRDGMHHPDDEAGHMNDEYGRIWLSDFLDRI